MVQMMMSSDKLRTEHGSKGQEKTKVRVKAEEPLDENLSPLNKRSRVSHPLKQQWGTGAMVASAPPPQQIPLDEPPLGLSLRKSPSLLDLIQMRLSQGNTLAECSGGGELGKKDLKVGVGPVVLGNTDKLKASNFPASLLRIGTWECVSRYEGDLVAKCYFAKHKLVWEVLDGGLKSKMEIQWSDIVGLKANYPENGLGTLDIVLARQPLFFRETNPQPRKHTLWQATSDFTGGQASLHRRHFVQCPQGLLGKHFEKLVQCDPRLNWLSQQPEIVLESPHFESKSSVFEDPDESKCHGLDKLKNEYVATFSGFRDTPSPPAVQSSFSKSELRDSIIGGPDHLARERPSPSSVMDSYAIEDAGTRKGGEIKGLNHLDQLKVPGLRTSMSMSDLVDHIGQCLSEQMTPGNPLFSEVQNRETLEGIAQYLLSDSQLASTSDEQSLMSRVNSLCCLLQKDPVSGHNLQLNNEVGTERRDLNQLQQNPDSARDGKTSIEFVTQGDVNDASGCKPMPSMSRKDSLGDLLLHLPRIASLPQFLFNIPEDGENQAR
ncbi:hypothetical protein Sjap_010796 [Stephania japonica]|uniref:TRF2/HOY1 PH-like domain-containing protein n=1 Tax=Stephania japonica TaxID=461633 RepID=A0AAP0JA96_9MAGN